MAIHVKKRVYIAHIIHQFYIWKDEDDHVRLRFQTVATNEPIVHPPSDI
jgi:hypothetical protein